MTLSRTLSKTPVQLTMGETFWQEMSALADRLGVTRSELVRHALEVYKLLRQYSDDGWEIQAKKGDETVRLVRL